MVALTAAALFVAVAFAVPPLTGWNVHTQTAPLYAGWDPRTGPGTVPSIALAMLGVALLPTIAHRLPWRVLLLVAWASAWGWTVALAAVDGQSGFTHTFSNRGEYLYGARRVDSVVTMIHTFTSRIPVGAVDPWHTHVAGHPPGALLLFVELYRAGLRSPWSLAWVTITVATTAAVAVLITVRLLAGEMWARAAMPFLVLTPAALWIGVSADAVFGAVTAWGLAALAMAATRSGRVGVAGWGLLSGLLLGYGIYLSYGLILIGVVAVGVLRAARTPRPLPWSVAGALMVVAAFSAAGFSWWTAVEVLRTRMQHSGASLRPYAYWLWGDLAGWLCSTGLAVAVGVAYLLLRWRRGDLARPGARALALLGGAGVVCVLLATVSGMSEGEIERIFLPFSVWALVLVALVPRAHVRWVLGVQAVAALLLQHLLITGW